MIKRFSSVVREYKKYAWLTPLFVAGEVILEVLIPLIMGTLLDEGVDAGSLDNIWKYGLLLLGCSFLSLFFGAMAGRTAAIASTGFGKNLRHDMYYAVQNYSFTNIDRFTASSLVTRMTTDVTRIQNAFQMLIRMAVRSPLMLIFSTIMAFKIHPTLPLVYVACLPVLGAGLLIIVNKAHPIFEKVLKRYDSLNNVVSENVRGMRVVKSFVREDFENKKFTDVSDDIYRDFSRAEKTIAYNMPLMQLCMYICVLVISWFGARIIVTSGNSPDGLTTGELTSLLSYVMSILMSLMMVSMFFVMITISRAAGERVIEVLDEKSDIVDGEKNLTEVKDGSVTFENVTFKYHGADEICLKDINLDIHSGETIGIIGGTGTGKSTLVQMIPRLYDATEGTVKVGGEDVRDYNVEALRDAVAMVLQKNVLFSGTIADNLRWGNPNATQEELEHVCRLAQAHDFIMSFPDGYETHIEQGGTNVSGGQKQRLCIARALLKKPKILILDDSTSAVDTHTDALIREAFRKYIPETTKFIIAQRATSVSDADRIIVLDGGRVVDIGTNDELMQRCDIYREVCESQMKGGELE